MPGFTAMSQLRIKGPILVIKWKWIRIKVSWNEKCNSPGLGCFFYWESESGFKMKSECRMKWDEECTSPGVGWYLTLTSSNSWKMKAWYWLRKWKWFWNEKWKWIEMRWRVHQPRPRLVLSTAWPWKWRLWGAADTAVARKDKNVWIVSTNKCNFFYYILFQDLIFTTPF